jgi:hypothetical protein
MRTRPALLRQRRSNALITGSSAGAMAFTGHKSTKISPSPACCGVEMEYKSTWDLGSIPEDAFFSELGRRNAAKRTAPLGGRRAGAGRKPQPVACPRCGESVSKTTASRGHGCGVPLRPAPARE